MSNCFVQAASSPLNASMSVSVRTVYTVLVCIRIVQASISIWPSIGKCETISITGNQSRETKLGKATAKQQKARLARQKLCDMA